MKPWGRPTADEHASFYGRYIALCPGDDLFAALDHATTQSATLSASLPPEIALFSYAPGKWRTIDVLQHVLDAERVFAYRALRFARNDVTELPGFEEDDYAREAARHERKLGDVVDEMKLVRSSTIALFKGLGDEAALRRGKANGQPCSVRALGWIIAGHELHHLQVIRERYLAHAEAQHS